MSDAHRPRASRQLATQLTDAAADVTEQLQQRGALDRRDFMRLCSVGAVATLVSACNARGGPETRALLKAVGVRNERIERWLLRTAQGRDRVGAGTRVAGRAFPSYFVSPTVPMWDAAAMGAWTLAVDGAVATPLTLRLDQLRGMGMRTQRVHHYCVEGWSAVAEFSGIPLAAIARAVRPRGDAGYVDFASFDAGYHESWDLDSVMHPQTLLVLAKDGAPLSPAYGAPARVHSPIKLGYKNTKYITRITFMPERNGGYWSDRGYEWFGGT
jgi:DMSO/TMAO reductase YedYZ molybdopterin-dependent catalytic subunit